ncbi:MAG TPA: glycosyltransferase family 39 protein [Roseiflexaceae bacterium]|nr:glycosyltransferase family 39 protein [Roseiflexaceae bacterium]
MNALSLSATRRRARAIRGLRPAAGWAALAFTLLVLCALGLRAAPTALSRMADAPDAGRFFHRLGVLERGEGRAFRWSEPEWGLALYGLERAGPLALSLRLSAARPEGDPEAVLRYQEGGAFRVARGWRTYHLLLDPPAGDDGVRRVAFSSSAFVPPGERNPRQLGVALHAVRAVLLAGQVPLVERRALFLATLALLLAATGCRAGLRLRWCAAAALVLAAALAALTALAPAVAGYWLPELWFVAGLWALALLAAWWRAVRGKTGGSYEGYPAILPPAVAVAGLALAALGGAALWLGAPWAGGGALLAGGLLAALSTPPVGQTPLRPRAEAAALALLTAVGLVLRLYRINELPPALWRDEARHGLLALQIWQTSWYRPVYEPAVDLPALILYLIAPLVGLFGPDLWTLRGGVALVGGLAPPALWFALRPLLGPRPALLAAALLAVSLWAIYMSRWAMAPILDVTLTLVAVGCAMRALRPGQPAWRAALLGVLGGACAGLALYTYHTGRLAPLVVAFVALLGAAWPSPSLPWRSVAGRDDVLDPLRARQRGQGAGAGLPAPAHGSGAGGESRPVQQDANDGERTHVLSAPLPWWERWSGVQREGHRPGYGTSVVALASAALTLALVAAPLAHYALTERVAFAERVDRVGLFNSTHPVPTPPAALLQQNLVRYTLMWHVEGDYNARHYAPRRPMLDPATGALFLAGLGGVTLAARRRLALLLLGWLALGLAPGVLSGDAPHAMRSIGALAPACALAALGAEGLLRPLVACRPRTAALAAVALVGCALAWNAATYLRTATDQRVMFEKFDTDETLIGRAVRQALLHPDPALPPYRIFLWGLTADKNVTAFLTSGLPIGRFDGVRLSEDPGGRALLLLPGDAGAQAEAAALDALGPGARLLRTGPPRPDILAPLYRVYGVGPEAEAQAARLPLP